MKMTKMMAFSLVLSVACGSSPSGTTITVPDCTVNDAGQKVKACGMICIPEQADCCDETTGRYCHPGNVCNGNGCS